MWCDGCFVDPGVDEFECGVVPPEEDPPPVDGVLGVVFDGAGVDGGADGVVLGTWVAWGGGAAGVVVGGCGVVGVLDAGGGVVAAGGVVGAAGPPSGPSATWRPGFVSCVIA